MFLFGFISFSFLLFFFFTPSFQLAQASSYTSIIGGIFTPAITFRCGSAFQLLQVKRVTPALEPWRHINTDFQALLPGRDFHLSQPARFHYTQRWSKQRDKSHNGCSFRRVIANVTKKIMTSSRRNSLKPAADLSLEVAIDSQ